MAKIGRFKVYSYAYDHNYGTNTLAVETPDFVLYFSYDTPIALFDKETGTLYVDTHHYSVTTSTKHRPKVYQHARRHFTIEKVVEDEDLDIHELFREFAEKRWIKTLAEGHGAVIVEIVASMF